MINRVSTIPAPGICVFASVAGMAADVFSSFFFLAMFPVNLSAYVCQVNVKMTVFGDMVFSALQIITEQQIEFFGNRHGVKIRFDFY